MARGPRRTASLQPQRPEFWVCVQRLDLTGWQVPGVFAAAVRGGGLESAVPVWSPVEGPAPPALRLRPGGRGWDGAAGGGSQRRDTDTPLLEPQPGAEPSHPLGYRIAAEQ